MLEYHQIVLILFESLKLVSAVTSFVFVTMDVALIILSTGSKLISANSRVDNSAISGFKIPR